MSEEVFEFWGVLGVLGSKLKRRVEVKEKWFLPNFHLYIKNLKSGYEQDKVTVNIYTSLGAENEPSTEYLIRGTDRHFCRGKGSTVDHVPVRFSFIFPRWKESQVVQTWCSMAADRHSAKSPGGTDKFEGKCFMSRGIQDNITRVWPTGASCVGVPFFLLLHFFKRGHLLSSFP